MGSLEKFEIRRTRKIILKLATLSHPLWGFGGWGVAGGWEPGRISAGGGKEKGRSSKGAGIGREMQNTN